MGQFDLKRFALLSALAGLAACADASDRPSDWDYVFTAIVRPSCATAACHSAITMQSGLDLSTRDAAYESLVRRPCGSTETPSDPRGVNVDPGHPETSPLMSWLRGSFNQTMPPDLPLPDVEIDAIERWILAGAPCEPR
ncbi:MAG TPA: hypothetical protein VFQ53_25130 [Kofleriaceae bacterium]|nr:hypothetical protein [Kofleriaceae bacterium]